MYNTWSTEYMAKRSNGLNNWQGRLTNIYTDKGGQEATVTIESRSITYHSTISYNSTVYKMLMDVDEEETVIFSGQFETKDNLLKERSMTESGRMYNPEFEITLTSINKK